MHTIPENTFTVPNVFSMEGLILINEINSIFAIYVTLIKGIEARFELFLGFHFININTVHVLYFCWHTYILELHVHCTFTLIVKIDH